MNDMMKFPDTVEEFMEQYKITDTEQIYTNGTELVPIFRMKQWFEHLPSAEPERHGRWIPCSERLPDKERKTYWICTDTEHQCECRWTNNVYGVGESDRWGWSIFDIPYYTKVSAWMPLPEPYKDGEQDG